MPENVMVYAPYDSEGKRMPLACPVEHLYDEEGYGAGQRWFATAEQGARADAALPRTGGTVSGNLIVTKNINGMQFRAGTKVISTTNGAKSATLFTLSQLNSLFGTSQILYSGANTAVFVSNGHYEAQACPLASIYYQNTWQIYTSDSKTFVTGNIRVNYLVIKFA